MKTLLCLFWVCILTCSISFGHSEPISFETEQITRGPKHHFFGYIGHVQNIPWNESGRFILALEIETIDRMPGADDAAQIVLLDVDDGYTPNRIDETRAWNPQQGTMFYWNPQQPDSQFFFNDRDAESGKVFTVLYDISGGLPGRRVKEYRFDDAPVGNSGVAQQGHWFMAINYGRLARLRPVTGYPESFDWTRDVAHPADDGIFRVNIETGEKALVVSYKSLADLIRDKRPDVDEIPLFINHTLWSRDDSRVYAFVRGGWDGSVERGKQINVPITFRPDGSELTTHKLIGGHPEWLDGVRIIGREEKRQAIYDTSRRTVSGYLGLPDTFANPEGDIALSPDGRWFVNGFRSVDGNRYTLYRIEDGVSATSSVFSDGGRDSGDLRIDPSPNWNRRGDAFLVPGVSDDGTRQMYLVRFRMDAEEDSNE
ncbi:MAG: hypothetical protein AMXMBFR84_32560 [Candidatus Hydrogenedentota bacterium]